MKFKYKINILLQLLAASLFICGVIDWKNFTSQEGRFSAQFPNEPFPVTKEVESKLGLLTVNMFNYDASDDEEDNTEYMVSYTDYSDTALELKKWKKETYDEFFNQIIQNSANNVSGRIFSKKNIALGKYEGREVRFEYPAQNSVITIQMILAGSRLYFNQVVSKKGKDKNAAAARFFNAFKINE
ncbi:MAG: hypothetical protein H7321_03390 [Bacteroidia bacterium]|nr:hypothetical protein [Bacteroidia bacterium]